MTRYFSGHMSFNHTLRRSQKIHDFTTEMDYYSDVIEVAELTGLGSENYTGIGTSQAIEVPELDGSIETRDDEKEQGCLNWDQTVTWFEEEEDDFFDGIEVTTMDKYHRREYFKNRLARKREERERVKFPIELAIRQNWPREEVTTELLQHFYGMWDSEWVTTNWPNRNVRLNHIIGHIIELAKALKRNE
jgi:hypothetical protein